ncbi:MAG TPA: glycosyltransferase family 39 protein [Tepidisphaeraceae bacterium]|jgi:4-amino-4-deoxy-L-arabinose transferase-like glycosyltransferase
MDRRSHRWVQLAIVSAAVLVFLIGNADVQLWDRDEPRFAQTSRQMLQSGDWVVPRFLDTVRTAKPAGIYWCQAAAMRVFGDNAFAARLPSVVGVALTIVLLMAFFGRANVARGLWAGLVFATAGLSIASAKMSTADGVLVFFVTVAQLCLFVLIDGRRVAPALVMGLALGVAGLIKGPVVLGVGATTLLAWWALGKRWRFAGRGLPRHEPIAAGPEGAGPAPQARRPKHLVIVIATTAIVMLIVAAPWLYLIEQRAPGFLRAAIGHDVIQRARTGLEGHSGPPGFYLVTVWGTFFPWSLLLPAALVHAWRRRHLPVTRFALAAVAGPWVMFELIATKLPHYLLPTFPFLAYLVADLLVGAARVTELRSRAFRGVVRAWAVVVVGLGCVAPLGLLLSPGRPIVLCVGAALVALVAIGMAWQVTRSLLGGRFESAAVGMSAGMLALVAALYGLYFPHYAPLRISANVADVIKAHGGYGAFGYMIDYKEPSLAFHAGGGLREQRDERFLSRAAPAELPEWVVVTERVWQRLDEEAVKRWRVVGRVNGVAYNDRGRQKVLVLQNVAPPAKSARIGVFRP